MESLDFEVKVECSKVAIFAAGPPNYDTVITMHTPWVPFHGRLVGVSAT